MIYIYDTVIEGQVTEIKRYGAKYKFASKTKMGNQFYYTFKASGRESLIFISRFAEQYRKVEQLVGKFGKCKDGEAVRTKIVKRIDRDVIEEFFEGNSAEETGLYVYTAFYKDIRVEIHYEDGEVVLQQDFEIKQNNIFGNNVTVTMNMDMED